MVQQQVELVDRIHAHGRQLASGDKLLTLAIRHSQLTTAAAAVRSRVGLKANPGGRLHAALPSSAWSFHRTEAWRRRQQHCQSRAGGVSGVPR